MSEVRNQTLQGRIKLDGKTFVECTFENAQLSFQGGLPPSFINCRFVKTHFVFENEAANTVQFLRGMLQPQSNMRHMAIGMLPELQQQ